MSTKIGTSYLKAPPILDDLNSTLEDYLLKLENLPIHKWDRSQKHWKRDIDIDSLLHFDKLLASTTLKADRDPCSGAIIGWKEVSADVRAGELSMNRPPLPPSQSTRGSGMQLPFWPAGFEEEQKKFLKTDDDQIILTPYTDEPGKFMGEDLLTLAPGLQESVLFCDDGFTPVQEKDETEKERAKDTDKEMKKSAEDLLNSQLDITEVVATDNHLIGLWSDNDDMPVKKPVRQPKPQEEKSISQEEELFLDECIVRPVIEMPQVPVLNITSGPAKIANMSTEWAENIDIVQPVEDFEKLIPNMAHTYPFELDTFQKQAILKLEEGAHVFVAAHTSAGKTVVAEYAIALSQKHCTRAVYTSPIKALSNQKYHDFKKTFGDDVGLLTGDLQINPTASCLVMTTEILRSMLYFGSDVTRDLEFVIFDEVHYINNAERGHVWEETLILLPAHVGIVLLSATVPNTLQFAHWVGSTKRRKVYVVSTPRRPVPLCHYLYTGTGGRSKHEQFMVLDQDGNFVLKGYNEAVTAKASRKPDPRKSFGPKGGGNFRSAKQDQTTWVAFIDHLRTNDKLPVVAFTLSRNRCDQNAEALMSVDLTTAKEKSHIHSFFQRCLQRLKEPDRKLPQVQRLQRVLTQGVGVHHSGILPLLKEIVEMLFQEGFVKILFATETFAMGVNMPARTVVFDEITKFDGLERRNLMPAEYIQMAGRAGRRGLDKTGTVIILCKDAVPDQMHLKEMMLGTPQKLSSQFRLTYSMILSLLRVETVSVEGMMQRSFREFGQQSQADTYRKQLEEAEKEFSAKCSTPLPPHLAALAAFYDTAVTFIEKSGDLMPILLEQTKMVKEMVSGKVLVVSVGPYINQLAILLNQKGPRLTPYKVLLLETAKLRQDKSNANFEKNDIWYRMLSLSTQHEAYGTEQTMQEHTILCISAKNILHVTKINMSINVDIIIQDWEKRQMARFRDAPVGTTCAQVVQELSRMSHAVCTGALTLEYIDMIKSLTITSGEILQTLDEVAKLKSELGKMKKATDIANFEAEFGIVFERKQTEQRRDKLRKLLSYESMALYPDYLKRLQVLRELGYIDDQHRVTIKGRVACEIGTNALIITELVFSNTFADMEPSEIAALLSCLVFQARTQSENEITPRLKRGVEAVTAVHDGLVTLENNYMVAQHEGMVNEDTLNFGLVKVVYEWARQKPFAEIMDLIDVQEGIIVRCIQQLHMVLFGVRDAAKIIGDPTLQTKMEEASMAIKRDIVFADSLYTTQKDGATI